MTLLTLVRHGLPEIDPTVPADRWQLSPDALPALTQLRRSGLIPSGSTWFSSPEPKATASADALTDSLVEVVKALREAVRPAVWYGDPAEFSALVRRSVLEPRVPAADCWESADQTQSRVLAAAEAILAETMSDHVVLVGHGTAWTLLVAALTACRPDLDAWQSMRMPDVAVLEVMMSGRGRLRRPWGQS